MEGEGSGRRLCLFWELITVYYGSSFPRPDHNCLLFPTRLTTTMVWLQSTWALVLAGAVAAHAAAGANRKLNRPNFLIVLGVSCMALGLRDGSS